MAPGTPYRLNLNVVDEGASHHECVGEVGDLDLDLESLPVHFLGPVVLYAAVYRVGQNIEVQGPIRTRLKVRCGRCLTDFETPLEGDLKIYADTRSRRDGRSREETREEDLGIVYHDGQHLDLSDEVRQVLLVEVPWNPVCQNECLGLCPTCGINRNDCPCRCDEEQVDPRWGALQKLKDQNRSSTE